ncbi:MAG: hypothetical protein IIB77_05215 [Proteobacteria bacterium]|nr:hypothetical protein [Pseudomonadota bacterium]
MSMRLSSSNARTIDQYKVLQSILFLMVMSSFDLSQVDSGLSNAPQIDWCIEATNRASLGNPEPARPSGRRAATVAAVKTF